MKYLIKDTVINADHIVRVQYMPADESINEKSSCLILTDETRNDSAWSAILRGTDADRFWNAYSSDAYQVVTK